MGGWDNSSLRAKSQIRSFHNTTGRRRTDDRRRTRSRPIAAGLPARRETQRGMRCTRAHTPGCGCGIT